MVTWRERQSCYFCPDERVCGEKLKSLEMVKRYRNSTLGTVAFTIFKGKGRGEKKKKRKREKRQKEKKEKKEKKKRKKRVGVVGGPGE